MEVAFQYLKPRATFGQDVCQALQDTSAKVLLALPSVPASPSFSSKFIRKKACSVGVSTCREIAAHVVNTETCVLKNACMRHVEGGWPKDVDHTEQADVARFRKKAEKDDECKVALKLLGPVVARCMKQNATIDIYQEYFVGECREKESERDREGVGVDYVDQGSSSVGGGETLGPSGVFLKGGGSANTIVGGAYLHGNPSRYYQEHASESFTAKGLAVFRDPSSLKRPIASLNWHPDGQGKLAVAYCGLGFQDPRWSR